MEVFLLLRNANKYLMYPKASLQLELLNYLHNFAVVRFIEFLGQRYCAMLLYVVPSDHNKCILAEEVFEVNKQRYASKIFLEYRQFKNYIANLEKRVMLVSIDKLGGLNLANVIEPHVGKHYPTKVNEDGRYLLKDPPAVQKAYPGITLTGSFLMSIMENEVDPVTQNWFVVEVDDKKICLTKRKLDVISDMLPYGSSVFRVRLFDSLLDNLLHLPKIRRSTMTSNHFMKPTSKSYYASHKSIGPKNCTDERSEIETYYRFNHSKN